MEAFVTYNDVISYQPIKDESTLHWGYDFMQNLFKLICYCHNNYSIDNITKANRPKISDFFGFLNLKNHCNIRIIERADNTLHVENVEASSDNPRLNRLPMFLIKDCWQIHQALEPSLDTSVIRLQQLPLLRKAYLVACSCHFETLDVIPKRATAI